MYLAAVTCSISFCFWDGMVVTRHRYICKQQTVCLTLCLFQGLWYLYDKRKHAYRFAPTPPPLPSQYPTPRQSKPCGSMNPHPSLQVIQFPPGNPKNSVHWMIRAPIGFLIVPHLHAQAHAHAHTHAHAHAHPSTPHLSNLL